MILALLLATGPTALGLHVQDKLTADDAEDFEFFGVSVALDGDTALVGALGEDGAGADRGAAHVLTRSGGTLTQQQKLTADDAEDGDDFGFSVALDGDTAIVGARFEDGAGSDRGAAYVYTRSGSAWSQEAKLTAADAEDFDGFGVSVALDGDTAIVGAPFEDGDGSDRGAAYVYTRSIGAWSQDAKLTADDAEDGDDFGVSVALDGDTALVGAIDEDGAGADRGAAYVFTRSIGAWSQDGKLTADDAEDGDRFGWSVALDGATALVGAVGEDGDGFGRGAAYVHTRSGGTWTQQQKLSADDAEDLDGFGFSVALEGDTALVGAPFEDGAGSNRGAAYAIEWNHAPTADFTRDPANPAILETVQFTDASTDSDGTVVAWHWDFGDGATSAEQNPSHQYDQCGEYTVTLTVMDDAGSTDTAAETFQVWIVHANLPVLGPAGVCLPPDGAPQGAPWPGGTRVGSVVDALSSAAPDAPGPLLRLDGPPDLL